MQRGSKLVSRGVHRLTIETDSRPRKLKITAAYRDDPEAPCYHDGGGIYGLYWKDGKDMGVYQGEGENDGVQAAVSDIKLDHTSFSFTVDVDGDMANVKWEYVY